MVAPSNFLIMRNGESMTKMIAAFLLSLLFIGILSGCMTTGAGDIYCSNINSKTTFYDYCVGHYYSNHKKSLDWAVDTEKGRGNGGHSELHAYAKFMGCSKESYNDFSEMIFKNKTEIFGEGFVNSSGVVVDKLLELIKADESLRKSCKL